MKFLMLSFITIIHLLSTSECHLCHQFKFRSILRGHYQNVMKFQESSLIISKRINIFAGGFDNSILFRNSIYYITTGTGFTCCNIYKSIIIEFKQAYEINTLVIWLYDLEVRTYDLQVFASYNGTETIVFDTFASVGVVRVKFADQFVKQFRIYSRNGNTYNSYLHILKVEAFYEI